MTTFMAWLGGVFAIACIVGGGALYAISGVNWDR